ncbi:hypothetical protein V8B55DRAFT_1435453 [Mucor lusitanicus]
MLKISSAQISPPRELLQQLAQRAYVRKVNINQNDPDYYINSTEASLADTRNLFI